MPEYATGSDYAGGLYNRSNYRVLLKMAEQLDQDPNIVPDDCRPWFVTVSGGYDTFGIVFHKERTPDEIVESLSSLADYPILDESDYSEMEMEKTDEAWRSFYEREYTRQLEKRYAEAAEGDYVDGDVIFDLDDVDGDDLYEHFREAADGANTYWESGSDGMNINIDRVVEHAVQNMDPPKGTKIEGRRKNEGNRMMDFFFGKKPLPPSSSNGGFLGLDSFTRRGRRRR